MDVGKRIRDLRERRGIEQIELAAKINISQSKMNKIETGYQKRIEPEILTHVARILGTSVDYLVGATDDPTPPKHILAGIPDDQYKSLSAYQQEVLDFMLNSETLAFSEHPENILEVLEEFEIYYELIKRRNARREGKD